MGTFVISLDAELAWGYHRYDDDPETRIASGRDGWIRLVDLFDEYQIPATWSVVGHLFHDSCDGTHASHSVPEGWFAKDPGGTESEQDAWYGRTLVDAVRAADVSHEIGCHSYSHVEFGDADTSAETAAAELRACRRLAEADGIDLDSFTFPRNEVGHRDVLAAHDFVAYRAPRPAWPFGDTPVARPAKLGRLLSGRSTAPVVTPTVDRHGLVAIPASLHLFTFEGAPRLAARPIRSHPVVDMAKRTIDAVAREEGTFHLWLHPHAVGSRENAERVRAVLEHARSRSDSLEFRTMSELARETLETRRRPEGSDMESPKGYPNTNTETST